MVLQKFGLDTFIHSLLKDAPGDDHRYDDIIRVKEAATGCLAQYGSLASTLYYLHAVVLLYSPLYMMMLQLMFKKYPTLL